MKTVEMIYTFPWAAMAISENKINLATKSIL